MTTGHPNSSPAIDEVIELIENYLAHYGDENSIANTSELDGYFAALACSPNTVMPNRWLSAIWNREGKTPAWENLEDYETFLGALMIFYNAVMRGMNDDNYQALFYERDIDGKTITIVDQWCKGFMRGYSLWGRLSEEDLQQVDDTLEVVRLFSSQQGWKQLDDLDIDQVEKLQQSIEPSIRALYLYFLKHRVENINHTVQNPDSKIGRNDPCPCGSGKKHKKCCLH